MFISGIWQVLLILLIDHWKGQIIKYPVLKWIQNQWESQFHSPPIS